MRLVVVLILLTSAIYPVRVKFAVRERDLVPGHLERARTFYAMSLRSSKLGSP